MQTQNTSSVSTLVLLSYASLLMRGFRTCYDCLLQGLSVSTTSTYLLQAPSFCLGVQKSVSDIHPHKNLHPITCYLLAFNLNSFSPTTLVQSLIANVVASSLLVRSMVKPLTPRLSRPYGRQGCAEVECSLW